MTVGAQPAPTLDIPKGSIPVGQWRNERNAMSTPVTTSLNAWRRVSQTERVAMKERGRVCAHEGCETILSIYYPSKCCSAHMAEALGCRRLRPGLRRRMDLLRRDLVVHRLAHRHAVEPSARLTREEVVRS